MAPAEVYELSWLEVAYLLRGSWVKRQEAWIHNSRICAMVGNLMQMVGTLGGGGNPRHLSPLDFMPSAFRHGVSEPLTDHDKAREKFERALAQDRAKTDRTNEQRKAEGLPPLPYKEI